MKEEFVLVGRTEKGEEFIVNSDACDTQFF
jgi:hypothetical protein